MTRIHGPVLNCDLMSRNIESACQIDAVANRFANLKNRLNYNRESSGFKNFRHTYRTVVDEAGDQPAILLTMGHAGQLKIWNCGSLGILLFFCQV